MYVYECIRLQISTVYTTCVHMYVRMYIWMSVVDNVQMYSVSGFQLGKGGGGEWERTLGIRSSPSAKRFPPHPQ